MSLLSAGLSRLGSQFGSGASSSPAPSATAPAMQNRLAAPSGATSISGAGVTGLGTAGVAGSSTAPAAPAAAPAQAGSLTANVGSGGATAATGKTGTGAGATSATTGSVAGTKSDPAIVGDSFFTPGSAAWVSAYNSGYQSYVAQHGSDAGYTQWLTQQQTAKDDAAYAKQLQPSTQANQDITSANAANANATTSYNAALNQANSTLSSALQANGTAYGQTVNDAGQTAATGIAAAQAASGGQGWGSALAGQTAQQNLNNTQATAQSTENAANAATTGNFNTAQQTAANNLVQTYTQNINDALTELNAELVNASDTQKIAINNQINTLKTQLGALQGAYNTDQDTFTKIISGVQTAIGAAGAAAAIA